MPSKPAPRSPKRTSPLRSSPATRSSTSATHRTSGDSSRRSGAESGRPPRADPVRAPRSGPAAPQAEKARRVEQVQQVLGKVLQWEYPADRVLSHWFKDHPQLGGRDRAEVAEAVFHALRHLRRLRHLAEGGSGAATRRLAILALAETQALASGSLTVAEQEWLARVQQIDPQSLPAGVRDSLPDWLDAQIPSSPENDPVRQALLQTAPLDLRVNLLKVERDVVLAELQAAGVGAAATPWSPWGIRLEGKPALQRWPRFTDGAVEVQDEGSQLLVLLLAPRRGELVIDFCAGAGGKTLALGAMMRSTGRLHAFDVSERRLARLGPRLARSGLSNVHPAVIANENDTKIKRMVGKAHRVLVDAPCSGTGTVRRNPDLKWRQDPAAIARLQVQQQSILAAAARCVAPGGRLVYATCSLLPDENEAVVQAWLQSEGAAQFRRLSVRDALGGRCPELLEHLGPRADSLSLALDPARDGTDGFFAAVLERLPAPKSAS